MTTLELRSDLVQQLWDLAQMQNCTVDEALALLLTTSPLTGATQPEATEDQELEKKIRFQARLLDMVEQAVIATDLDGMIIYWNRFAEKLYGWSAKEAIGISILKITPPASQEEAREIMEYLQRGESWSGEFMVNHRDGTTFPAMVTDSPIFDEQGKLMGIVGLSHDITERKKTELALRKSEARLRSILDATLAGVALMDRQGMILDANENYARRFDTSREELIGQCVWDMFPAEVTEKRKVLVEQVFQTGKFVRNEDERQGVWNDYVIYPVKDDKGQVVSAAVYAQDISRYKHTEENLRIYETAVEASDDLLMVLDENYTYVQVNQTYLTYHQLQREDIVGHTLAQLLGDDFFTMVIKPRFDKCLEGEIQNFEAAFTYPERGKRHLLAKYSPIRSQSGIIGVAITMRDITERKRTEESLLANQQLLDAIFRTTPIGICLTDVNGNYVRVNEEYCRIYEFKQDEVIGQHFSIIMPPGQLELAKKHYARMLGGDVGIPRERIRQRSDGSVIYIEAANAVLYDKEGTPAIITAVRDVTVRKQAELALRDSEERYRKLVEILPEGVVIHQNGKFVLANHAALQILGATQLEQIIGKSVMDFVHPAYQEQTRQRIQQLLEDQTIQLPPWEQTFIRVDGQPIDVEVTGVSFMFHEKPAKISVFHDITERKQAEKRALELAVEKKHVQILRDFMTAVSHDFRTPLSVMSTSVYLLKKIHTDEMSRERLAKLDTQVRRMAEILDNVFRMMELDSLESIDFQALDINKLLENAIRKYESTACAKNLDYYFLPVADSPVIQADKIYLELAVTNLISNALNYTPEGGRVFIRSIVQNQQVIIEIKDTGIGISKEDQVGLFERFYRADKARRMSHGGGGLGLAITRKIVELHQGQIEVDSQPGRGSTFRIILPRA